MKRSPKNGRARAKVQYPPVALRAVKPTDYSWRKLSAALASFNIDVLERGRVRAYLDRHHELAEVLWDACERARQGFGDDTELSLRLYCDPEINDRYLTLYIRPKRYSPDLLEQIDAVAQGVQKKWDRASGYLLLTTDFCGPRE